MVGLRLRFLHYSCSTGIPDPLLAFQRLTNDVLYPVLLVIVSPAPSASPHAQQRARTSSSQSARADTAAQACKQAS